MTSFVVAIAVVAACSGPRETVQGTRADAMLQFEAFALCYHLQAPWSDEWCPDTNAGRTFRPLDSTVEVSLHIRTLDGKVHVTTVNPKADVIFLTQMAVDSVFAGYYRSKGPGDTASVRKLRSLQTP
ncbi:MAG: hypothetical protein AABZ80_08085 [Gemmatimonadota bacterium]